MTSSRSYDVIVAGVGGMGSAALSRLADRRLRVLGLEQFTVPNDLGSSHGLTRIIRLAFHEGPAYVPLGRRAYELWRDLEHRSAQRVLHITGSVHAGAADAPAFQNSLRSCVEQDVPHTVLSSAELSDRFPGYRLPLEMMAIVQNDGGFLAPERCVAAYAALAIEQGAHIHEQEPMLEWTPTSYGVRVRTHRAEYEAGALVLAVGAWAGKQLPELARVALPERQAVAWFAPRNPELFQPSRFPVFVITWRGEEHYGFPAFGVPGYKVGKFHHHGEYANPDALDRNYRPADEQMLRAFTEDCFPNAAGPLLKYVVCMFTNSPDRDFIIGNSSSFPQVSFAAGFSGHGFKFCSVVGEIMADLAQTGQTPHDISPFDPHRFH